MLRDKEASAGSKRATNALIQGSPRRWVLGLAEVAKAR